MLHFETSCQKSSSQLLREAEIEGVFVQQCGPQASQLPSGLPALQLLSHVSRPMVQPSPSPDYHVITDVSISQRE